jgi:hypothetical protein
MRKTILLAGASALFGMLIGAALLGDVHASGGERKPGPVGVWFAKFPDAPFKYHIIAFNSDGTMQQANPDAGDAHTSDSDGMGIWRTDGDEVKGKFVEITADRSTRAFVSRGEISFEIAVKGDSFSGNATGNFYDLDNKLIVGPVHTAFNGSRVTLP